MKFNPKDIILKRMETYLEALEKQNREIRSYNFSITCILPGQKIIKIDDNFTDKDVTNYST